MSDLLVKQLRNLKPCVPPGIAAVALENSSGRVRALMRDGKLEYVELCGARFVTVDSILRRRRLLGKISSQRLLPLP